MIGRHTSLPKRGEMSISCVLSGSKPIADQNYGCELEHVIPHPKKLITSQNCASTFKLIRNNQGGVQNQLIHFELLLTAPTFVATVFAVATAVFGMNFNATIFDEPTAFNWVLILTGVV